MSLNFDFLTGLAGDARDLAAAAEMYAYSDPGAAAAKLRVLAERLLISAAAELGIDVGERWKLNALILLLARQGQVRGRLRDDFRALQTAGDNAVHVRDENAPPIDALALLPSAHRVAAWYCRTFHGHVAIPEYREPPPRSADAARLKAEADQMLAALALEQRERLEADFARREERLQRDADLRIAREIVAATRAMEEARTTGERALAEARAASAQAASAAREARRAAAERAQGVALDEDALRRRVEAILAVERQQHVLELDRIRQEALRRAGTQLESSSDAETPQSIPTVAVGAGRTRPRRPWKDAIVRPGWECYYATAGGRLRAVDPLGGVASAGVRAALSQVAVFVRGVEDTSAADGTASSSGAPQTASGRTLVGQVLRRLVGRGARPPVDPEVERAIIERAGLRDAIRPSPRAGELCGVLRENTEVNGFAVQAAALYREPFMLDSHACAPDGSPLLTPEETALVTDGLSGAFGPSASQWLLPHVAVTDLLAGEAAQGTGPGTGLLVTYPLSRPTIIILNDGSRENEQVWNPEGIDVDVLRLSHETAGDPTAIGRRLESALPPLGEIPPREQPLVLAWGAAVAQRVLLGVTEGVERGWLTGARWCIEVEEPCGIAVEAVRSAVEIVAAVAAVWGAEIAPERVDVLTPRGRYSLVAQSAGAYVPEQLVSGDPTSLVAQLRIRIECLRGPLHLLPTPDGIPEVVVRSASLPLDLMEVRPTGATRPRTASPEAPPAWALRRLLGAAFGKRDFQPEGPAPRGQEVAVRRALAGHDTVVLLPTGAGKSMIYQLAGLLTPGVTLVIDPIIALIDDQVDGLSANGIDRAVGISSADRAGGTVEEKLGRVRSGDAWFVFIAPERLQIDRFRRELRAMTEDTPVSLATVDEAHCVSEWGHDFRPAYLDLGRVLRTVAADATGSPPPILALTGTASRSVLKDMLIELGVDRADPTVLIRPTSFDRQELRFAAVATGPWNVDETVAQVLKELPGRFHDPHFRDRPGDFFRPQGADSMCGIVFCQTVDGQRGVANVSRSVSRKFGIPAPIYAGSAPGGWTGDFETAKRTNAAAFKASEVPVLFATKAYGMGIDKPNVRFIIHVGSPASIEAYYQEAGRAGRDRREAQCIRVHTPKDRETHDWFMGKSYAGIKADIAAVKFVLKSMLPIGRARVVHIPMLADGGKDKRNRDSDKEMERAIHRLRLLGIVSDYLIDRSSKRFEVHLASATTTTLDEALIAFVRRSQPGRATVMQAEIAADGERRLAHRTMYHAHRMISFVYDTIVAARRRALDEMLLLGERGMDDQTIRDGILSYLDLEGVAQRLEPLVERESFTFADWLPLYEELDSVDDAGEWRGAAARFLESEPDHPGLLLGRALAELVAPDGDVELYVAEAGRAFVAAGEKYGVPVPDRASALQWLLGWIQHRNTGPASRALGRTLQITPRALGDAHLEYLSEFERRLITDPACDDPVALQILLDRRLARHHQELLAIVAKHLASSS